MSLPSETPSKAADVTTTPVKAPDDRVRGMAPWADVFSKCIAGLAIALYASGFLVLSLYHSKFGFVGTNPFRPRVLAAGAWFLIFTAIPVWGAARYRTRPLKEFVKELPLIWIASFGTSVLLITILFEFNSPESVLTPISGWRLGLYSGLFVLSAVGLFAEKMTKMPEWAGIAASALLTLMFLIVPIRSVIITHTFDASALALWFFGCTVLATQEFKLRTKDSLLKGDEWTKVLFVVFAALVRFAHYVSPHLRTSWGGGSLTKVTIYLTETSLLKPGQAVQASLVEESDEGYYIIGPSEGKAVFIPRSSVALVYFSEKASDSSLLQGGVKKVP
jgi:hypothetical protein